MKNEVSIFTKVRHRNEINPTFTSLPLSAKRLLFLALSQVNPRIKNSISQLLIVTADDYLKLVDVKDKSAAYKALKEGVETLEITKLKLSSNERVELYKELGENIKKSSNANTKLNLLDLSEYAESEGYVRIRFGFSAGVYLTNLIGKEKYYTTQVLFSTLKLTSVNSSNLYQLIRKMYSYNKNKLYFDINIDHLKDEMGLYDLGDGEENSEKTYKYPSYPIFKRDVLNKSISEITKKTEIKKIEFEVIEKEGRAASKLRFKFLIEEIDTDNLEGLVYE